MNELHYKTSRLYSNEHQCALNSPPPKLDFIIFYNNCVRISELYTLILYILAQGV